MSSKSRSRNCSSSETESVTDISCEENIQVPSQRFILSPGMYYHDTVYRTYSYAPPVIKNYPPAVLQPDLSSTISTCVKPEVSSYRYRYYAPNAPVPASRLIKGEAAPKRYEQSMSFQNFPQRMYPTSQSYDGSFRNVNFDPMFNETRVEQFNRPVSNMWQMAGSSANTTSSSQKFLNQYNPVDTNPQGYGNYFQDKNVFNNNNVPTRRKNFKLKALGIIGLVFLVVISVAVVLSIVFTRSSFSARSLLKSEDKVVNETIPRLFINVTTPINVSNSSVFNISQTTDLVFNLTTVLENTTLAPVLFNETLNVTESFGKNVSVEIPVGRLIVSEEIPNNTTVNNSVSESTITTTIETTIESSTTTTESSTSTTEITTTITESSTTTTLDTTIESTISTTTIVSTELLTTTTSTTTVQLNTTTSVLAANNTLTLTTN